MFPGHFPVGDIVGVKLKKLDESQCAWIIVAIPVQQGNDLRAYSPILLLRMNDDAIPCSLLLGNYERYKRDGWKESDGGKKLRGTEGDNCEDDGAADDEKRWGRVGSSSP